MMYLCTTRFELEEEQRILFSDSDSDGHLSEADEAVEMSDQEDLISDDEEGEEEDGLIPDHQIGISEATPLFYSPWAPAKRKRAGRVMGDHGRCRVLLRF
jgi:hypothetical protein